MSKCTDLNVGKYSGLDIIALAAHPLATSNKSRAFILSSSDVAHYFVELSFICLLTWQVVDWSKSLLVTCGGRTIVKFNIFKCKEQLLCCLI